MSFRVLNFCVEAVGKEPRILGFVNPKLETVADGAGGVGGVDDAGSGFTPLFPLGAGPKSNIIFGGKIKTFSSTLHLWLQEKRGVDLCPTPELKDCPLGARGIHLVLFTLKTNPGPLYGTSPQNFKLH